MMQVDFAIITIRPDEFDAVLQRFPTKVRKGSGGQTYGISQVTIKTGKKCKVGVVRCSEQGNDAAQQVANDVINDLDPQMILVVGIAGGIPHDAFTLGDVIVSTRINNLNVSKRSEDGKEEFDMRGGIHPEINDLTASLLLYQKELAGWNDSDSIRMKRPTVDLQQFESDEFQAKIADEQKKASWYKKVHASLTSHFGSERSHDRSPLFVTGTIASTNSVIRNIDLFVQWLSVARSILAVEMESAGVYQAAQKIHQQYPVMAIRGISDIIGFERDIEWTNYACQTAAAFAYALVTAGVITPRKKSSSPKRPAVASPLSSKVEVKAPRVQSKSQTTRVKPLITSSIVVDTLPENTMWRPLWNVPYQRNPFFTGRDDILMLLRERLSSTKNTALTQSQAFTGLGGIGKTQLAVEYAYRYRKSYDFVFWVGAETHNTLLSGYMTIAKLLQLPEKDEQDQEIVINAVKRWLSFQSKWLLILDNADDLKLIGK